MVEKEKQVSGECSNKLTSEFSPAIHLKITLNFLRACMKKIGQRRLEKRRHHHN